MPGPLPRTVRPIPSKPKTDDNPIKTLLDKANVSEEVKAAAWDAFYGAADQDELVSALDKVNLPDQAKAFMWDRKVAESRPQSKEKGLPAAGPVPFKEGTRAGTPEEVFFQNDAGLKQADATLATMGGMALGGPVAAAMRGPAGVLARAAMTPKGAGIIAGGTALAQGKGPVRSLGEGVATALGLRGAGALLSRAARAYTRGARPVSAPPVVAAEAEQMAPTLGSRVAQPMPEGLPQGPPVPTVRAPATGPLQVPPEMAPLGPVKPAETMAAAAAKLSEKEIAQKIVRAYGDANAANRKLLEAEMEAAGKTLKEFEALAGEKARSLQRGASGLKLAKRAEMLGLEE